VLLVLLLLILLEPVFLLVNEVKKGIIS